MNELHSARLVLRSLRPDDAATIAAYRSDPEVARYQSWDAPFSLALARQLVAELADGTEDAAGWRQWAVALAGDGGIVGDLGVHVHDEGRQAEIGYTVAASHQRRGYAFEAVARMLDHLFADRRLHRVTAECDSRNTASAGLLERLGFRREGELRASTWSKGEWSDDYLYALLADEWRGSPVAASLQPPASGEAHIL